MKIPDYKTTLVLIEVPLGLAEVAICKRSGTFRRYTLRTLPCSLVSFFPFTISFELPYLHCHRFTRVAYPTTQYCPSVRSQLTQ
jgi:hypothetical protein